MSALLEHWLGWDHHTDRQVSDASPMPTSWADRLVSHLVEEASPTDQDHPSIWVRKFCSEIGCDVLKKQDNNGKTLLHHLLSGNYYLVNYFDFTSFFGIDISASLVIQYSNDEHSGQNSI